MLKKLVILILVMFMVSCASLNPNFQTPEIKVVSITPASNSDGSLTQNFNLGLQIMNPNSKAIDLVGMSYKVEIDGFSLLSGVAKDIPRIDGYSEERVNVTSSISLLDGLRFINSLLSKSDSKIDYKMTAKLDTGIPLIGKVPVTSYGKIDLSDLSKTTN
jgi:LEA14-like dessication related protein